MASETLRYDVISAANTQGLKDTARDMSLAAAAAKELDKQLRSEIKTAEVASAAAKEIAKADKLAAEANALLAESAGEASRQLRQEGRNAEEAAAKTKLAANAAKGGADGFTALRSPLVGVALAGAGLAPIAVTLAAGLGGLGLAALAASKHTQAMNTILGPLKQEVHDFQGSLQPQVFTLFGDGAGIARDALKQLQPVAAATGTALHQVLGQVGAEFRSGEWKSFFQFMAAQAGPDLQLIGKLLVDVARDLPGLLTQLQPAGRLVLILADDLLKVVGGLEKMHLVLPLLGAAIGFMVGGPLGALIGGLAGVALQAASTNTQLSKTGQAIQNLSQLKPVTSAMVGFAGVAGEVAANMSQTAGSTALVEQAMAEAHPKVGTLAGDMATLNATIGSGNSVLAAYTDLWNIFVGKSVSYQQAVLNLKQAFEGYDSAVKSSGKSSTAAQQAFLGIFTTLGTGLETARKQHASIDEINRLYAITFSRLSALHGLTPQQRQDIAGLTQNYIAWASATDGLNKKLLGAAGTLRDTFLAQLANGHRVVPQTKADLDALASSVLKTGTDSTATAAARARLISDIYHSGLTAQAAQSLVRSFQGQINALKGKTVNVDVTASGSGGISVGATGLAARIFKLSHLATGGRVPGSGTGDTVPAMLTPGEVVVPVPMVRAGAVDHLRGRIPGFAAGGVAGMVPFTAGQEGSVIGGWAGQSASSMMDAILAQLRAQAAAASGSFTPGAPATGSAAAAQAFARSILPGGWSWPALLSLWQRESGWNAYAVNPSSGAYGIPQSLGHGHPYNLGDYANQVRWGISYIAGRYGNSQNAWAHELAFNWYDKGGYLPKGLSLAYNGTGRPEPVIPAGNGTGPLVIELHLDHGFADAGLSPQMLRNIKATVRHLGGRGPDAVTVAFGNN